MNELPVGLLLELVVTALLMVTVVYCFILNRRLKRLRHAQNDLRDIINDLTLATQNAESAIAGLKVTAEDVERNLGDKLDNARLLTKNLALFVEKGQAGALSATGKASDSEWLETG